MACHVAAQPIRVLFIEADDAEMDRVLASLGREGIGPFSVVRLPWNEDTLKQCATGQFDVLIVDTAASNPAGLEIIDEMRRRIEEVPVVALCSEGDRMAPLDAMARGAHDCLAKTPGAFEVLPIVLTQAVTRQRLASQLEESEYRLRLLAEQLPALLWTTDDQFRLTSWRGKRLPSQALSASDVVGRNVGDLAAGTLQATRNLQLHHRAFSGESVSGEMTWSDRWYHAHLEPLRNLRGEVIGTIGVAVDVTHERKLMKDIAAAHQVQQHLLPATAPKLPGFDIAGACYPAEDCSGDFFDYIQLPQKRLAVVLADVSGHGFAPAIMASAVRSYLRAAAVLGHHVHEMLAICNRLLVHDAQEGPFATVFAVRIDAVSNCFQFTSAGHSAHLIHANGAVDALQTPSVPIGVVEEEVFPLSRPILLERSDILLLASDGLFETRSPRSPDIYGLSRAVEVVRENSRRPSHEIVERLHRSSREYAAGTPPEDDLTAVVIKRS